MGYWDQAFGGVFGQAAQAATGLNNLYGAYQGSQNAANTNQQVQAGLGQNAAALQAQIDALNGQISTNRQQAQDMYQRSLTDVTGQNTGLQGNIDTMTTNLNALSDPNSPYMQMARQGLERKDAAAGRNSQWGDREVQLAAQLADYVGKYSPGINQSITQSRNQINQNNQGLASLYSAANAPADRNTMAQIQAIQQQLANVNAQNTAGNQAANRATNANTGLVNQGITGLGQLSGMLSGLFGNNSSGNGDNMQSGQYGYGAYGGLGQGFTGGSLDNDYLGLAGTSSLDQGMGNYNPYNYTSMIGDYSAPLDFNDPDSGYWD